MPRVDGR